MNKALTTSVYDKHLEVHYNEWFVRNRDGQRIKLNLQGKIKCPLLNSSVSSLACSSIMDRPGWPRDIDENSCKKCDCYIYISIRKFQERKHSKGK